jgi:protoporphyrinogen oxidase
VDELSRLGILEPRDVLDARHHFVPNAYPVYASGYEREVLEVQRALEAIENLDTLGRAGRFVYSHLHDQLRFGRDYVQSLAAASSAERVAALHSA